MEMVFGVILHVCVCLFVYVCVCGYVENEKEKYMPKHKNKNITRELIRQALHITDEKKQKTFCFV